MKLGRHIKELQSHTMKPIVYPEGFIVIVDTREQHPLFTPPPKGLTMVRNTLLDGDYSIVGMEPHVFIERKGISDLYTYCSSERKKTQEKLGRASGRKMKLLAIEASESDILSPQMFTKVSCETVRQALVSIELRFGVHVYYNRNRREVERWLMDRMIKFYKNEREIGWA
jgi:ERCC4-type nuclease